MPRIPCILIALLVATPATAQTLQYSIAPGKTNAIHQTLDEIQAVRSDGTMAAITVTLTQGIHRITEPIRLNESLVADGLTIKAANNQPTIITGSIPLSGNASDDRTELRFQLPAESTGTKWPRVILVNGQLSTSARFPQSGFLRIQEALPDRRSGFLVNPNDMIPDFNPGSQQADVILLHDWSSSRMPVASHDHNTRTLKTLGPLGSSAAHYAIDHFEKQPRFWLEGHPDFATKPEDWYIDRKSNELVILTDPNAKTTTMTVGLPVVEQLLVATGDQGQIRNLKLQGLTFTGTKFPMPEGGLAGSQATMHERRLPNGQRNGSTRHILSAAVLIENAIGCSVKECRFQQLGNTGLWIAGRTTNCTVSDCKVTHVGGNGINAGEDRSRKVDGQNWDQATPEQVASNIRIERCNISFCGRLLPGSVAIWASLHDSLTIANNQITDCPYTGISLGWIWNDSNSPARNNRIINNRISFVMQMLSDGAGIYTLGNQPNSILSGNTITDVPLNAGRAESNAIFCDEGTTGFTIEGNTTRRIAKSPVRFHKAGKNIVRNNQWELKKDTPPARFNSTPEEPIEITNNITLETEPSILLIGNSLTWDTRPGLLDGNVHWHVDCGKPLTYIRDNPEAPCVSTSRLWPLAIKTTQYDFISVQPHGSTTLQEDLDVISGWVSQQPQATFIIHTGWARSDSLTAERNNVDSDGPLSHSNAHFQALIQQLESKHPNTAFRCTNAMNALFEIADDIKDGQSPLKELSDLYRDPIHMKTETGRYLMHNAMRIALKQPPSAAGFPEISSELKSYLDGKIRSLASKQASSN